MSVMGVQVVYIDSDLLMHQALGKVLRALGLSFRCFCSMEEVQQNFADYDPKVVIIDVPTFERTREYQEHFKGRTLALVTSTQMSLAPEQIISSWGISAILSRPIDRHALASFLGEALYTQKSA